MSVAAALRSVLSPSLLCALLLYWCVSEAACEGGDSPPRLARKLSAKYSINRDKEPLFSKCVYLGSPSPDVAWNKDGVRLPDSDVASGPYYVSNGTLVLQRATPSDSGRYSCIGSNRAGMEETNLNITILVSHGPLVWTQWWMYFVYILAVWLLFVCVLVLCCCYQHRRVRVKDSTSGIQLEEEYTDDAIPLSQSPVIPRVEAPVMWAECSYEDTAYHLIDLSPHTHYDEWTQVTETLKNVGYIVQKVQRVQNLELYKRYQLAKQQMKVGRRADFETHEILLYHTTIAEKSTVCEFGLDEKTNRPGMFGKGIYFSDSPDKCNRSWHLMGSHRLMFACYVLLGEIKEYPPGRSHNGSLRKEPRRSSGRPSFYDSIKGNLDGHDEYVITNKERAYPAYTVEYTIPPPSRQNSLRRK